MRISDREGPERRQKEKIEADYAYQRGDDCRSRAPRRSDEQNDQKKHQGYRRSVDVLAKQLQQAGCGKNCRDRGAVAERCFVEELKPHWQRDPFGWQLIADQSECSLLDPEDCL